MRTPSPLTLHRTLVLERAFSPFGWELSPKDCRPTVMSTIARELLTHVNCEHILRGDAVNRRRINQQKRAHELLDVWIYLKRRS
jgi:hypothetical protein